MAAHGLQRKAPLRPASLSVDARLWNYLRILNRQGYHFRRRAPFHSFLLPFAEHEKLLVIELREGEPGHAPPRFIARDRLLTEAGYSILRFWRRDAEKEFATMTDTIRRFLESC